MRRLVLACLVMASLAAPVEAAACGRDAAIRSGSWVVSTPPLPPHTGAHASLYGTAAAVGGVAMDAAARVVLVTDGARVHRSDNGGCTWTLVYALPDTPGAGAPDSTAGEITSIDLAVVGGRTRVLLTVQWLGWHVSRTVRTVVVRSDDGYRDWTAVIDPVTFTAVPDVSWSPVVRSVGTIAYAAVPGPTGTVAYARSGDGGRTWAMRTPPTDKNSPRTMTSFAVNPWNPDELWEWGGRQNANGDRLTALRRSSDGGGSWLAVDPWPMFEGNPSWFSVDIAWPAKLSRARLFLLGKEYDENRKSDFPVAAWSGDGGATFAQAVPPKGVPLYLDQAVLAHLANGDVLVVTASRYVYRVAARRVPRASDWKPMRKTPEPLGGTAALLGYDVARASTTKPGVVVLPTLRSVWLLAVAL